MSENGGKVVTDLSFIEQIQSAPVGRRGSDADSERGKVREFFFSKVLEPMVASQATKSPITMIELTDVICGLRQLAREKDGTQVSIPVGEKLRAGQRWFFLSNLEAPDERYRGLRNYITGLLKSRKEFALEKHPSKKHGGKELTFIVFKQAKAVKA
jgi:hypothetical protein